MIFWLCQALICEPLQRKLNSPALSRLHRDLVADRPIAGSPLSVHPGQYRDLRIDVIVDHHVFLGRIQPVQPTRVLRQRPAPRNG